MSKIKSKNTNPEILVRSFIHRMGYRFRLHCKELPGKPDIVLPRYKKIIFVHGCFWHRHNCRYGRVIPKTNKKYWDNKRKGNVERFKKNASQLKKLGWNIFIVWECQTRDIEKLKNKISDFLDK